MAMKPCFSMLCISLLLCGSFVFSCTATSRILMEPKHVMKDITVAPNLPISPNVPISNVPIIGGTVPIIGVMKDITVAPNLPISPNVPISNVPIIGGIIGKTP